VPERLDIRDVRQAVAAVGPADIVDRARQAAISAVLREADADLEVLLIRRATREGDPWSGHMALPGGHFSPSDRDLLRTAVRETREEVGLDLELAGEYLGRLDDFVPAKQFDVSVRPFVFSVPRPTALQLGDEVVEALWVPLSPLLAGTRRAKFELVHDGRRLALPAWDIDGRVVWGLTYRVLELLLERLRLGRPMDSALEKR
jgi:8-oxo-dGTP pyrophosphatase MutT (NUDIX family)